MARRTWLGGITAGGAQLVTLTLGGTWEADDEVNIILTGEDGGTSTLNVVAGSTTISTVATTIATAFNASVHPLFTPITAAAGATTVTLTADTAGTPFYVSVTTTETGGGAADAQTFTDATTTANKGPYDWNTAANWAEGAVPVATNDVELTGSHKIRYGLNQSAVAIAGFRTQNYTGAIGAAGYNLRIDPDSFEFSGTGKAYIDIGAAAISPRIIATASATAPDAGLHLIGSAMSKVRIEAGSVAIASTPGLTATAATVEVTGTARAQLGSGLTLTNYHQINGNSCELGCAATTVTADAGTLTTSGTGAYTTFNNNGATVYPNSSGTVTTYNANAGTTDATKSRTARTFTALNRRMGAIVKYDPAVLTVGTLSTSGPIQITNA